MRVTLSPNLPRQVVLPTSKSISARALIIRALSATPCALQGLSDCDDTQAVLRALDLGGETIDIGAAGTAMRFLTAYYAAREGETRVLTGTARMQQRPIGILVEALRRLGAEIEYLGQDGCPPLRIRGRRLPGGDVQIAADVSSQYISAILMIGPTLARGLQLRLEGHIASRPYILMTLRLMEQFGAKPTFEDHVITVPPTGYRRAESYAVEPDWSAASYWYEMVALSPDPEAQVLLCGLQQESLQGDSICATYFRQLGVATTFCPEGALISKMPVADAERVLTLDFADCPDLAQTFVVTAAMMGRAFRYTGLQSLRIKETDRIAALITEMAKLGVTLLETAPGTLTCHPSEDSKARSASGDITIRTYCDHRMAMAFAPAAYSCPGLNIEHPEVVTKSYPTFWTSLPITS